MKKSLLKRVAAAATAAIMIAAFSSCGKEEDAPASDGETTVTTTASGASSAVNDEIRDLPSTELVKEIKIGWSLGNTLDAPDAKDLTSETSWGNPYTTKEMITAVKDAGFNIIRFPTTWGNHMDEKNNVDEAWLDRVQEVVDYAYSQDMFVILNIHHEDWHDPYYETEEAAIEKLTALWTQIGTRFAGYDEKLIFEGLNEPRKRNTAFEWNGGDKEGHDVVNSMNAAFVETIRGLGGNNAKRHLMIPAYAASSTPAALNDLIIPDGDDKIIVSVHAYLPYMFALDGDLTQREFTPDEGSASEIVSLMDTLKTKFIDNNIAVIIGEFGARAKVNTDIRAEWATYYISKATEIGVPCVWWDNGAFSGMGENFGLLNRNTCTWEFPEVVEGLMKGLDA
ncbi:MAG: glycoside hydrolase family 5 protein [Oscillospiraceae bacterium]|nr:glycoside hydrolase family 5 protein [Oscillospiraceae bacterium]